MNLTLPSALFALAAIASLWFVLLWLWSRRGRHGPPGRRTKILAGIATMLLLFVPVGGAPLWNRVFSFYPNPCLPMLGIVCAALWSRLFHLHVFHRADWTAIWTFGAAAGTALYLHPMLFGAVDLYYWGWDREVSAWAVGVLAAFYLAWGCRFGVLLLAALLAYAFTALESHNCWDYIADPFYWLISLGVLATRAIGAMVRRVGRFARGGHAAVEGLVPVDAEPQTVSRTVEVTS